MRKTVTDAFKEMHEYYDKGYTPRVKTRKGCLKCSLRDICLPQLTKKVSVRTYINRRPPLERSELLDEIDKDNDSIRFYNLGNNYHNKVEHYGTKVTNDFEDTLIF